MSCISLHFRRNFLIIKFKKLGRTSCFLHLSQPINHLQLFNFPSHFLPPHRAILSSFATVLQLLHWILFVASRYNLLYALSWCGLTIFAVFVCFRYRSITLLLSSSGNAGNGSSISKVLRHRHQRHPHHHPNYLQQEQQLPASEELVPTTTPPWENGYNQLHAAASPTHSQQQRRDNQKHSSLTPVAEEREREQDDAANAHIV